MSDNNMIALQECMDLLKIVPGPGSEASVACSHIKVEEDIDVQEQKDPLLLPFPFIKLEQEVSCMSMHCHTHFTCVILSVYLYMKKEVPILLNGFICFSNNSKRNEFQGLPKVFKFA
jgi:hypothetical protein